MSFETSLPDLLHKLNLQPSAQYLKNGMHVLVQLLMDLDVSTTIDAEHYERSSQRVAYRNGYRRRRLKTTLGTVDLRIPKLRKGSYYPKFLTACEQAIIPLLQMAYFQRIDQLT